MIEQVILKTGTIDTKSIIIDIPGVEFQGNFLFIFVLIFYKKHILLF